MRKMETPLKKPENVVVLFRELIAELKVYFDIGNVPLFNSEGRFNATKRNCRTIDVFMAVLTASSGLNPHQVRLKMMECGVFVTMPDYERIIAYLTNVGIVAKAKNSISNN